jgi:two-component system chemotaxis response regulator CheY
MKILFVEDDEMVRFLVERELAENGFTNVSMAVNGVEGLRMALENTPDLIITDVQMPEMDGLTLLKNLKVTEPVSLVPVFVFSASNDINLRERAKDLGASGYFYKPYDLNKLIKTLTGMKSSGLQLPSPSHTSATVCG